jgi:hypothetical protein
MNYMEKSKSLSIATHYSQIVRVYGLNVLKTLISRENGYDAIAVFL